MAKTPRKFTRLFAHNGSGFLANGEHGRDVKNSYANLWKQLNTKTLWSFFAKKLQEHVNTCKGKGLAKNVAEGPQHGVILQGGEMYGYKQVSEVAEMFGVTNRTVRNWISTGLIVAYKRNNSNLLIDERSLDAILTPVRGATRG